MEESKDLVSRILSHLGFRVEEIPECQERRADLRVFGDQSSYHIEVKDKYESPGDASRRMECFRRGEMYEQEEPLKHDNRISAILRDACQQLDSTPNELGAFQLIWFNANGIDADLKYRQAFSTFYGDVPLVATYPRSAESTHCFYFDYSAAFVMPTVEALILSDRVSIQLCVNEFAHRVDEFRGTDLYRKFAEKRSVLDPLVLQQEGKIIACRSQIARNSDHEVCEALQQETGILYSTMRLKRYSWSVGEAMNDPE